MKSKSLGLINLKEFIQNSKNWLTETEVKNKTSHFTKTDLSDVYKIVNYSEDEILLTLKNWSDTKIVENYKNALEKFKETGSHEEFKGLGIVKVKKRIPVSLSYFFGSAVKDSEGGPGNSRIVSNNDPRLVKSGLLWYKDFLDPSLFHLTRIEILMNDNMVKERYNLDSPSVKMYNYSEFLDILNQEGERQFLKDLSNFLEPIIDRDYWDILIRPRVDETHGEKITCSPFYSNTLPSFLCTLAHRTVEGLVVPDDPPVWFQPHSEFVENPILGKLTLKSGDSVTITPHLVIATAYLWAEGFKTKDREGVKGFSSSEPSTIINITKILSDSFKKDITDIVSSAQALYNPWDYLDLVLKVEPKEEEKAPEDRMKRFLKGLNISITSYEDFLDYLRDVNCFEESEKEKINKKIIKKADSQEFEEIYKEYIKKHPEWSPRKKKAWNRLLKRSPKTMKRSLSKWVDHIKKCEEASSFFNGNEEKVRKSLEAANKEIVKIWSSKLSGYGVEREALEEIIQPKHAIEIVQGPYDIGVHRGLEVLQVRFTSEIRKPIYRLFIKMVEEILEN